MLGMGCRGAAVGIATDDDTDGVEAIGVEAIGNIDWGEATGDPTPLSGGTPCWRQLSLW